MVVHEEFRKCVFFIAAQPNTTPQGTGFLVSMENPSNKGYACYAITARHCVEKAGDEIHIRFNKKVGGFEAIVTRNQSWCFHPDASVDLAAIQFDDSGPLDMARLPTNMIADEHAIREQRVGLGSDVFVVGLFTKHAGKAKNIPIVRMGNIASMPEEPVETNWSGKKCSMDAYLIECRSIKGLSGSPVFALEGPIRHGKSPMDIEYGPVRWHLLGLIHGHWDVGDTEIDFATDSEDE